MADTLARVATLPTTVQLAHAVAALVGSQARLLEVRNLAERVGALERTLPTWPQAG